jgi:hypothetical protein
MGSSDTFSMDERPLKLANVFASDHPIFDATGGDDLPIWRVKFVMYYLLNIIYLLLYLPTGLSTPGLYKKPYPNPPKTRTPGEGTGLLG